MAADWLKPLTPLPEVRVCQPEAPQSPTQPAVDHHLVLLEGPGQCCAQVVVFPCQTVQPDAPVGADQLWGCRFGEGQVILGMQPIAMRGVGCCVEPLASVLTNRIKHFDARCSGAIVVLVVRSLLQLP